MVGGLLILNTIFFAAELVGAIAFSLALAILYEGLKTLKELLTKKAHRFLPLHQKNHTKINPAIEKHR